MVTESKGFTLIEVMVTVAIIAILSAIAYPSYADYVLRGYLVDATNGMAAGQAQLEQFYQDNRTYDRNNIPVPPCPDHTKNFQFNCAGDATSYSITAVGQEAAALFSYTYTYTPALGLIKATTATKPDWGGACGKAWVVKKGQLCT